MIYSILATLLFIAFFLLARKSLGFDLTYSSLAAALRTALLNWKDLGSIYLLTSFFFFMLLPFFWGLAFFLKTDANVIIVILCFSWIYNWTKYIFLFEKLEK